MLTDKSKFRRSYQASTALGSTIIQLQDQAPTTLEESVLRSSFFQDQAPTTLGLTIIHLHHCSSRSSPKALEDPFITVIQDQASTALEETLILKIKPQRLLEDSLKSTFKIKPTALEERSSLDQAQRPFGSINIHKPTSYGDRIR
ncbi:hypothetical protein PS1_044092 [Malus domestica]